LSNFLPHRIHIYNFPTAFAITTATTAAATTAAVTAVTTTTTAGALRTSVLLFG
jgi:hypothetical protein